MRRADRLFDIIQALSLLSRLQSVLGPLWVWGAFGEVPPVAAMVGRKN